MPYTPSARTCALLIIYACFALLGSVLISGVLIFIVALRALSNIDVEPGVDDPEAAFTESTGLEWPSSATVIAAGDDHRGLINDGEFYLILRTDQETIDHWLSQKPPWGGDRWKTGGVPDEAASHCRFGAKDFGPSAVRDVLQSPETIYRAEDRQHTDIPWHNGRLMAIDPKTRQVFVSYWDF